MCEIWKNINGEFSDVLNQEGVTCRKDNEMFRAKRKLN